MGWGLTNTSGTVYGNASGVQRYISAFTFTSSSNPNSSAVEKRLQEESAVMDGRLYKVGFAMPITDTDAITVLTRICEMTVAADMWEQLVLSREPSLTKVETANVWRSNASALFEGVLDGTVALGDDLIATGRLASAIAGVSNAATVIDEDGLGEFAETYGEPFDFSNHA